MLNKQLKKMEIHNNTLHLGRRKTPLEKFPDLVVWNYKRGYPSFIKRHFPLEQRGDKWGNRLPSANKVEQFFWDVCIWGGFPGIAGRVLKKDNNEQGAVDKAFRAAHKLVRAKKRGKAVEKLMALYGLGLSFVSKQLRMMFSRNCVVLDGKLQEKLPYTPDSRGYDDFCHDCEQMAKILNAKGIKYPQERLQQISDNYDVVVTRAKWRAADVEFAIFACVNKR